MAKKNDIPKSAAKHTIFILGLEDIVEYEGGQKECLKKALKDHADPDRDIVATTSLDGFAELMSMPADEAKRKV